MNEILTVALALIALFQNITLRRLEARVDVLEGQKWYSGRDA